VIALGRAMLAALFLVSMYLDRSQPQAGAAQTYLVLLFYLMWALGLAAMTWRNWWLDARLAAPAHLIDMAVFTAIVFSTNGYTSPFFLFFVLPLLAAAIRWGWRQTAVTAAVLIVLYLSAGLLVARSHAFEAERFIARSGHLVILSTLLIWFGIHQRSTRLFFRTDEFDSALTGGEEPLAPALAFAMRAAGAQGGALLLESQPDQPLAGVLSSDGQSQLCEAERLVVAELPDPLLLFARAHDRCLTGVAEGRYRFAAASTKLDLDQLRRWGADEGLLAEVHTGTQSGWLLLWDIADLSTDYLDVGRELGRAVGTLLDRDALFAAIEAGAAARTRLSLARDVHDSVVQFLAGASFRIEAITREARAGHGVDADLQELKGLLIEEQAEIRGFIAALRRDRELQLAEAVEELRALAERLSRQWSIECRVESTADYASIPIRLQLDLQQLLREAVANAVRHGGADRVDVGLAVDRDQLRFEVKDNGSGFTPANGKPLEPRSLSERIERARGSLSVFSEPGCTNIVMTLPLSGAAA
jgi:signal transduction histidine kinase